MRDTVVANAALALVAAGVAADFESGRASAELSVDSGAARRSLERLVAASNA